MEHIAPTFDIGDLGWRWLWPEFAQMGCRRVSQRRRAIDTPLPQASAPDSCPLRDCQQGSATNKAP